MKTHTAKPFTACSVFKATVWIAKFLHLYTFGTKKHSAEPTTSNLSTNPLLPNEVQETKLNEPKNQNQNKDRYMSFLVCFAGLQISFLIWGK
jgi:hypothetical protein